MSDVCQAAEGDRIAMSMLNPVEKVLLGPMCIMFTCDWYCIEQETFFGWFK